MLPPLRISRGFANFYIGSEKQPEQNCARPCKSQTQQSIAQKIAQLLGRCISHKDKILSLSLVGKISGLFILLLFVLVPKSWSLPQQPTPIVFWHSMAGQLGEQVRLLAQRFNASQQNYVIKPMFKGNYNETLTSYAAAYRAKHPPQLVQIFEVGTSSLLQPQGIVKPVTMLMTEQGFPLDEKKFFPAVQSTYSKDQQLMALPFNTSVPVMFYNEDALLAVGWKDRPFPRTWDEFEQLAQRLLKGGYRCAYTSTYPSWILIESFSALHGLPLFDGKLEDKRTKQQAMIKHLERLQRWQNKRYFQYGGRMDDSVVLFTSGKCPIISQSSGSAAGFSALVPFHLGVAPMPLDMNISKVRHNNVVGGAAIWVSAGQSPETEQGIAQFLNFLIQPQTQQLWYQNTGYLPLEGALIRGGAGNQQKILSIATLDLNNPIQQQNIDFRGPQNQIRTINDQMLESIFSTKTTPQAAMKQAVERANHAIRRFMNNNA